MAQPTVITKDGKRIPDSGLHWDPIRGRMVAGLEQSVEELEAQEKLLHDKINSTLLKNQERKMLKGTGFITVVPSQPRLDVEEHATLQDAQNEASDKAYQFGTAIIYAPIEVVRPKRDTVSSQPSKLMEQVMDRMKPSAIAAGGEVKKG